MLRTFALSIVMALAVGGCVRARETASAAAGGGEPYGGGGRAKARVLEALAGLKLRHERLFASAATRDQLCSPCVASSGQAGRACDLLAAPEPKLLAAAREFAWTERLAIHDILAKGDLFAGVAPFFEVTQDDLRYGKDPVAALVVTGPSGTIVRYHVERVLAMAPESLRLLVYHELGHTVPAPDGGAPLVDDTRHAGDTRSFTSAEILDHAAACVESASDFESLSAFLVRGIPTAGADGSRHFPWGDFLDTTLRDNGVGLPKGETEGCYLSPLGSAGGIATAGGLTWLTEFPVEKELPDNGARESGYPKGNIDMAGNELLLHLNENSPGDFADGSGRAWNISCSGNACPLPTTNGRLNGAYSFDGTSDYISINGTLALSDDSDYSLAAWYRGTDAGDTSLATLLGWDHPDARAAFGIRNGRPTFARSVGGNWTSAVQGAAPVADDRWHHLVYVNHANGKADLFVDGKTVVAGASYLSTGGALRIAGLMRGPGGRYTRGTLDETAIWRRALGAAEAEAMYLRGAAKLRIRLRAVDEPRLADGTPFVGPDATATGFFSEREGSRLLPPVLPAPPLEGKFFQYEACFESLAADLPLRLLQVFINIAP